MTAAEGKFRQYGPSSINSLLEKSSEVKLAGKATRSGDKLDITVEMAEGAGEDIKLRLLVVEETVKYAGRTASASTTRSSARCRAAPDGSRGEGQGLQAHRDASTSARCGRGSTKYLDEYVADNPTRPFARPDRPMAMKDVARHRPRAERQDRRDRSGAADRRAGCRLPAAAGSKPSPAESDRPRCSSGAGSSCGRGHADMSSLCSGPASDTSS